MSITFLSEDNFVILGTRTKTMGINLQGNVLVFFKMTGDSNCGAFEPVFAKLSRQDPRVSYAILDVSQNKSVVAWSRETSTQITAVPMLILYVNGRPHAKFNGTKNTESIQNFITKALQATGGAAAPQQQFMAAPSNYPGAGGVRQSASAKSAAPQAGRGAKMYTPDIGKAPSMKGIIKGGGGGGYAMGNNVEDDDEPRLMMPDNVVPHNAPWEAEINELEH